MTWQALRGVPVVAPDAPPLLALFALLAAAGTVASVVVSARRAWAR